MPAHALDDLQVLCRRWLEPLRRAYGPVTVVSGYRTRRYNLQVGGAPHSYHVYRIDRQGVAADVSCARGSAAQWYAFLNERGAPGLGRYADHVHVDTRPYRARW